MSSASEILDFFRVFIPKLSNDSHKGQSGKICVIGGSREYTGAPYFASIAALKIGADLSHVICPKDAAPVIKSYSSELMVHPLLGEKNETDHIMALLEKMHVLIIGPGLGRDENIYPFILKIIEVAKDLNKPMVIDADGLHIVTKHYDIVQGYRKIILTPNPNEFKQMYSTVVKKIDSFDAQESQVTELAKKLSGPTICRKGHYDIISDGTITVKCETEGSPRRCGGQGDLLSGMTGVLLYWTLNFVEKNLLENVNVKSCEISGHLRDTNEPNEMVLASYVGCTLMRECNKLAFAKYGRSTLTSDMIAEIHSAFTTYFGP